MVDIAKLFGANETLASQELRESYVMEVRLTAVSPNLIMYV